MLLRLCLAIFAGGATLPFVTTWRTSIVNESITLPIRMPVPFNLTINWGDNQNEIVNTSTSALITHLYPTAALYNVSILGDIYGFGFRNTAFTEESPKIVDIVSWGDGFFVDSNSDFIFYGCTNLQLSASPASQPVFSPGANLAGLFWGCSSFNSALNWNLTNVRSLSLMFYGATQMNQSINFSNMNEVTETADMFSYATSFNQPLDFDTSNVIDMRGMFDSANMFNQPVNFNTSNVRNMSTMFAYARSFNQPVHFDTSNVANMLAMFYEAASFNHPVNFNTSNIVDLGVMFAYASNFNQPVDFDTRNVRNMNGMFANAASFNQPVNFDTTKVMNMRGMFFNATSFNQSVNFDTSNVTSMAEMFASTKNFNQPVNFDTSKVTDMRGMFNMATKFNQPVHFDTGKVDDMSRMFFNATSFNQPVNFSNTSTVSTMQLMFAGATSFNQPINFQGDYLTTTESMFERATSFNQSVVLRSTNRLRTVRRMFANANKCFNNTMNISSTARVTDMREMFLNVDGFQQNLEGWDTRSVVNCSGVCPQCGLPSCLNPCDAAPVRVTAENISVCNLPNKEICGALCESARVSANLQARCVSSTATTTATKSRGMTIISPLFEITQIVNDGDPNSSTNFVFTLPIVSRLHDEFVGTIMACDGTELSCEWLEPESLEFQRSGCAVSRERVEMGSGIVGTECTCTHLTVFALALRSELQLTPLCHAQEVDYALLVLYSLLACVLMLQSLRVFLDFKLSRPLLVVQHFALLLSCVLRVLYLVLKPVIKSLWGLVLLGLLPSSLALVLFIHMLLVWTSLQLSTLQLSSPFAKFRKPFLLIVVLVLLLLVVLVVLVGATSGDVAVVRGGSYVFAALSAIVCVLVLVSGFGLRRSLSTSASTSTSTSSLSWREPLRHRVLVATVLLSVCLFAVACLWAAAVQTDIIVSSAATLATSASFYVLDWLSLCVMTWLFSGGVKRIPKR